MTRHAPPRAGRVASSPWVWLAVALSLPALVPLLATVTALARPDPATLAHLLEFVLPRVAGNTAWLLLGVGLGTVAFVAFIARTTHPLYTATQLALFTSLAAVPRTFINATTGYLVELLGWFPFFMLCALLAVPGMVLLLRVAPWHARPAAL